MRKSLSYLLVLSIVTLPVFATHEVHFKEGETIASLEKGEISSDKLDTIPGYKGDNPSETHYFEGAKSISDAAMHKQTSSEEGNILLETQAKRQHFEVDPSTDPLFAQANTIIANPTEAIKVTITEEDHQKPIKKTLKCYECRGVETHKCTITRSVSLKKIEDKKHIINITGRGHVHHWNTKNSKGWRHYHIPPIDAFDSALEKRNGPAFIQIDSIPPFPKELSNTVTSFKVVDGPFVIDSNYKISHHSPSSCRDPVKGAVEIIYKPNPTEADLIEIIDDQCIGLEVRTEEGTCRYGTETILEGPATKNLDGLEVARDWWKKERTYICNYPSKNDCEPLRARGCFQTSSRCNVEQNGNCVEFEQTYECVSYPASHTKPKIAGDAPFCLTGDCANQSWNPNQNMAEVMAKLSLLKELKNEMDLTKAGRIFRGTSFSCSKHTLSFSDCCGLSSGWGESLHLTSCSESEKLLSKKRSESKCHQVGTYCAEKGPLGIGCLRKKTTFCCFESRLARTIHEQGRAQLGINWGTPEGPDCRPFTIEEFSRIDFNRINFSEIFSEVWSKIKVPDASKIADQFQKDWKHRLPNSAEITASKLPEVHKMKNKVSDRRAQVSSSLPAGSYSLNNNPPPMREREEQTAEVVF